MHLAAISLGYLVGSIPFAFLASRYARGIDIRRVGSGNAGAANVLRTSGAAAAVCVMLLDMAKGAAAVLCMQRLTAGDEAQALAGLAAVVGHVYPVWLRGQGGKGVATAAGVFGVLTPLALLPAMALFVCAVWVTRYISLGSLLAAVAIAPLAWRNGAPGGVIAAAACIAALIVFRHRSNVARLLAGTERRIGQRVIP